MVKIATKRFKIESNLNKKFENEEKMREINGNIKIMDEKMNRLKNEQYKYESSLSVSSPLKVRLSLKGTKFNKINKLEREPLKSMANFVGYLC